MDIIQCSVRYLSYVGRWVVFLEAHILKPLWPNKGTALVAFMGVFSMRKDHTTTTKNSSYDCTYHPRFASCFPKMQDNRRILGETNHRTKVKKKREYRNKRMVVVGILTTILYRVMTLFKSIPKIFQRQDAGDDSLGRIARNLGHPPPLPSIRTSETSERATRKRKEQSLPIGMFLLYPSCFDIIGTWSSVTPSSPQLGPMQGRYLKLLFRTEGWIFRAAQQDQCENNYQKSWNPIYTPCWALLKGSCCLLSTHSFCRTWSLSRSQRKLSKLFRILLICDIGHLST